MSDNEKDLINPFYFFCHFCKYKKRISQSIKCKCEFRFCFDCRIPEKHNCIYDYKTQQKKDLEKKLIKSISNKIEKII